MNNLSIKEQEDWLDSEEYRHGYAAWLDSDECRDGAQYKDSSFFRHARYNYKKRKQNSPM